MPVLRSRVVFPIVFMLFIASVAAAQAKCAMTADDVIDLVQGLKDRGVPTRFIRFPREPHGFREPHHVRIRDTEEIAG